VAKARIAGDHETRRGGKGQGLRWRVKKKVTIRECSADHGRARREMISHVVFSKRREIHVAINGSSEFQRGAKKEREEGKKGVKDAMSRGHISKLTSYIRIYILEAGLEGESRCDEGDIEKKDARIASIAGMKK